MAGVALAMLRHNGNSRHDSQNLRVALASVGGFAVHCAILDV
jgi:hypothetical protein